MCRHIAQNPFYVLELSTDGSAMDVEMQGQKILGMLELGLASARAYPTPLGEQPRDADRVRTAMAELRDPRRRAIHELWARLPPEPVEPAPSSDDEPGGPWTEAFEAMGWRR